MIFLGVDNGTSGSIGIVDGKSRRPYFARVPVFRTLNYTKSKQFLNRINGPVLVDILKNYPIEELICTIERPFVNPGMWRATMSAVRAMEATLIVLEMMKIPYQFIDSKEWQRILLPKGVEGDDLKPASLIVGKRLFPTIDFTGFRDADGLLIAEHARRSYKNGE